MTLFSITIMIFLIMNPLGILPVFLATLKPIDPKRHAIIILRETFIAFIILTVFMFFGEYFLRGVQISDQALGIAGGIILFLIALRMVFPEHRRERINKSGGEPFMVPLAIPMTAGPGAMTTVMLLATQHATQKYLVFFSLTIASIAFGCVVLAARYLSKFLGEKGLHALERLSGMMLTAVAVQMFLTGLDGYFRLH